jgi:hypothetical protein
MGTFSYRAIIVDQKFTSFVYLFVACQQLWIINLKKFYFTSLISCLMSELVLLEKYDI